MFKFVRKSQIGLIAVVFVTLCGCEGDLAKISDDELRKKIHDCDYQVEASPMEAQACANYHRECTRRLNSGRFVCK